MEQAAASPHVSFEDYFEAEVSCAADAQKHEWFDGVVYSMSRGTPEHGRLTSRVTIALGNTLPSDCQVYASDTMLYIKSENWVGEVATSGATIRIHEAVIEVDKVYL